MEGKSSGALDGIRVLDFTRVLAGPLCTMMLGDLGAEVVKVENPGQGDDTRQWGPPWLGEGANRQSAYFLSVNRNKRSLTLNLKTERGRNLARRLTEQSHILVENFKVGQMAEFGLGVDDLSIVNPRLVYCSITGYGQTGPYKDRPGYDYVIQAMSGLMSITGPVEGTPHKVGVAISDVITGLFAVSSILAALRHAEKTGQGQYLDVSLLDSQIATLVNIASNYLVSGQTPPRLGNEHPNIVPYQVFRASDLEFVVAVGNDRQFVQLCNLIEQSELAEDTRFATNPARVANRDALIAILHAAFLARTADDWVTGMLAVGIPSGPIHDIPTALNNPHVQSRGLIHEMPFAEHDILRMVAPPIQFSETPPQIRLPPPYLGQHTDEILRGIVGMDDTEIAKYRRNGVI